MANSETPTLNQQITDHLEKYGRKLQDEHRDIAEQVTQAYKELNEKLRSIYTPVVAKCHAVITERNSELPYTIEYTIHKQFFEVMRNCNTYNFELRNLHSDSGQTILEKTLDVDCSCVDFETYTPYGDDTFLERTRMTCKIQVTIPSVAIHNMTDQFHCLTDDFIKHNYVAQTCLAEFDYTTQRYSNEIILEFDYEINYLDLLDHDHQTMPDMQTSPTWSR